ncbi:hypothetical protein KEM52_001963 [Ascosphaera acerosa]|nr:hypothetical protein KEM52_001963 [Ascosphaera acerosa]
MSHASTPSKERLQREEEMEARHSHGHGYGPRRGSLSGGGGGGGVAVPTGPKALTGATAASSSSSNGPSHATSAAARAAAFIHANGLDAVFAESDSDVSDSELEQRRQAAKQDEQDKYFADQERRWLNRERSRTAALEREQARDREEARHAAEAKEAMRRKLAEWDDAAEAARRAEEYYADHGAWLRTRTAFRQREAALDEADRALEQREKEREAAQRERARGLAEDFLARQAEEIGDRIAATATTTVPDKKEKEKEEQPQRFKMSLGAAAQKQASAKRRTAAEVEGLLETEEDGAAAARKPLTAIRLEGLASDVPSGLTEEERAQAARQLAAEIPTSKEGLWGWRVAWEFVDEGIVAHQLKPFVEKKIVEYLGVQEQMLVDVVEEHVRRHGAPQELVDALAEALDEEAEVLVKKLWRMIIFFSESEKRGLGA